MKYDGTKTVSVVYMMQSWLSHESNECDAAGVHAFLVKKGQAANHRDGSRRPSTARVTSPVVERNGRQSLQGLIDPLDLQGGCAGNVQ